MADEEKVVPTTEQTSTEESSSETTGTGTTEVTAPEALTKEQEAKVRQMIAAATATAVEEARKLGRTELQSQQDRNKAELARESRRASIAEKTLKAARTSVQAADPDIAKELELAELRAEREGRATSDQEEASIRQQAEFHQQFQNTLSQFVTNLGVDPKDKRIDWATDASNYLEAQRRVLDSVAEIQKANLATLQSGFDERLKKLEGKTDEENTEANSVNTASSTGVVTGSDAEFVKKFAAGELPMSKANIDRYNKTLNA